MDKELFYIFRAILYIVAIKFKSVKNYLSAVVFSMGVCVPLGVQMSSGDVGENLLSVNIRFSFISALGFLL